MGLGQSTVTKNNRVSLTPQNVEPDRWVSARVLSLKTIACHSNHKMSSPTDPTVDTRGVVPLENPQKTSQRRSFGGQVPVISYGRCIASRLWPMGLGV